MGAPRRSGRRRTAIFGTTVDYVLKASPCRVLLAAGKRAA
jgi:nucleotide-binding universal stress UspA family protein